MMDKNIIYAGVMLLAGIGIPVMAALNAGLGVSLKSPTLAVIVLLLVASLTTVTVLLIQGVPKITLTDTPYYFYLAGILFVFYILSITWIAPKFGIANAVFFILLGQLISSAMIDHFGLFNAVQKPLDLQGSLGLLLMLAGIFVYVK